MLPPETLEMIRACASEFNVGALWLFGSSLGDDAAARDIDLAVEGIDPKRFYEFYGRLFFALPKPVDLVDMAEAEPIVKLVRQTGVRIYERKP